MKLSLSPRHAEAARFSPTSPVAYFIAFANVALATELRIVLTPWLTGAQFITLFPAVMLTTFLCGFRAGLFAIGLGALAAWFFVNGGAHTVRDNFALAMFIAVAMLDVVVISALLRANTKLTTSEARFRDLLESAPDAMVIVDRSGQVVLVNTETEHLFGFARDEILGRPLEHLIPTSQRRKHAALVQDFMRSPKARPMGHGGELKGRRKDGSDFPVEVSLSPLRDRGDGLVCAVIRDISARRAAEDHQTLLIHELNHRVKNTLATVQSIARQTLKSTSEPLAFHEAFNARLIALSQAHDVLTRNDWTGASLSEVIAEQLKPYQGGSVRFSLSGPEVILKPRFAVALGMVFGELSTNAAKYGAFSREDGRVAIDWAWSAGADKPRLDIVWRETNGPPVKAPERRGFGSQLIERSLAHELGGSARLTYDPAGLICELRFCP